jgi:BASS family bile acid:Na+ symporter
MQSTVLTVALPAALSIVMLGLGLSLTVDDFRRIRQHPGAIVLCLLLQLLVLPAAAYGVALIFGMATALAVGMMLLAATPSGATSTLFTHLARGDTALCLTLTALTSILSVLALPPIVNFGLSQFMGEHQTIPLQVGKTLQVFAVVLPPVGLGMLVRHFRPQVAARLDKPVRILSAVFLVGVIGVAVWQESGNLGAYLVQGGPAVLAFNLLALAAGYFGALALKAGREQATAVAMSLGVRNGTLAITIAASPALLNNMTIAIPPAVYSLLMFFTAAGMGFLVKGKRA